MKRRQKDIYRNKLIELENERNNLTENKEEKEEIEGKDELNKIFHKFSIQEIFSSIFIKYKKTHNLLINK